MIESSARETIQPIMSKKLNRELKRFVAISASNTPQRITPVGCISICPEARPLCLRCIMVLILTDIRILSITSTRMKWSRWFGGVFPESSISWRRLVVLLCSYLFFETSFCIYPWDLESCWIFLYLFIIRTSFHRHRSSFPLDALPKLQNQTRSRKKKAM